MKRGSGGKPAAGKTRGGSSGKSNPKDKASSRKTTGSAQPASRLAGSNRGRGRGGTAAGRGGKAGAKSAKPAKLPAPAAAAGEEEDVELSDEDVAFFAQHQNFARFLSGLEEQQLGSDDDDDIDEVMVFADSSAAGLGSLPQKGAKGKAGEARRADKGKGGRKGDGAEGEEEEGAEAEGEDESEDEEAEYERGSRRPGWAAPAGAAGKFAPKPRAASAGVGGDAEEVAVELAAGAEGEKKGSMRGFGLIAARDKGVLVDAVDALPVKTLDGRLMFRAIEVAEGAEGEKGEKGKELAGEKEDGKKGRKGKKGEEGKGGPREEEAEEGEEEEEGEGGAAEGKEAGARRQPKDASKLTLQEQAMMELQEEMSVEERRAAVKKAIARMSTQILADPETHIGMLKSLHKLCLDLDAIVASLAVLSLTAVFRDIIPGYRVRMRSEKERAMVMSKEVKKRWLFEEGLLQSYQSFVNLLLKHAKQAARRAVSVRAMCGLLRAAPHFNCRSELIRAIIPRMDLADDSISSLCCNTIAELMREDGRHDGEATVEAAELVADFIRQRCCVTRPQVLMVFHPLEFDDDLLQSAEGRGAGGPRGGAARKATWGAAGGAGGAADGEEQQPGKPKSKKERKLEKRKEAARMRKEVEGDFREAEAVRDESTRKQQQARVLAAVFEALFRVVKAAAMLHQPRPTDGSGALSLPPRPLLPSALFLIGHFSHLLSVEYLPDLLSTLRQLAADVATPLDGDDDDLAGGSGEWGDGGEVVTWEGGRRRKLGLRLEDRLTCCVVAQRVMKANLDSLNVDMRGFVTLVYQMILEAPLVPAQVAALSSESPSGKASSLKAPLEEADSLEEEAITPGGSAISSLEAALVSALQEVFMSSGHRQADMTRCAAFIKRLSAAALHLSAAGAVAVLLVVRHLLLRYPRCRVLLDKDPDDDLYASGGGLGPYGGLAGVLLGCALGVCSRGVLLDKDPGLTPFSGDGRALSCPHSGSSHHFPDALLPLPPPLPSHPSLPRHPPPRVDYILQRYDPAAPEPELSAALTSFLWELSLLSRHYHPHVASLARHVSTIATSPAATAAPGKPSKGVADPYQKGQPQKQQQQQQQQQEAGGSSCGFSGATDLLLLAGTVNSAIDRVTGWLLVLTPIKTHSAACFRILIRLCKLKCQKISA
ncbi:unnamed protein product [Closterium sp. NIES-64]|nr:unnamed protein product [Closterium sp. NIES-64]